MKNIKTIIIYNSQKKKKKKSTCELNQRISGTEIIKIYFSYWDDIV